VFLFPVRALCLLSLLHKVLSILSTQSECTIGVSLVDELAGTRRGGGGAGAALEAAFFISNINIYIQDMCADLLYNMEWAARDAAARMRCGYEPIGYACGSAGVFFCRRHRGRRRCGPTSQVPQVALSRRDGNARPPGTTALAARRRARRRCTGARRRAAAPWPASRARRGGRGAVSRAVCARPRLGGSAVWRELELG